MSLFNLDQRPDLRRRTLLLGLAAGVTFANSAPARTPDVETPGDLSTLRSAVGAREPLNKVVLDGVSIAYNDTGGRGRTVICLHAIGHGARDFEDLSHRLRPDFRVIAIDWPGQGNSGSDAQPACGLRYTKLLELFVEHLGLNSFVLLGNSIGGAVSVRYANRHPDRVRALVLCDSGGLGPVPDAQTKALIEKFAAFFETGVQKDPTFGPAFRKYYETVLIEEPARAERERIIRSAYEIAPVLAQAWRSFASPEESLWEITPTIRAPVLFAWAKDDHVLPLEPFRPALARFPNHRLDVFQGGHAAFLEDPDRFEVSVRQFLQSTPGI